MAGAPVLRLSTQQQSNNILNGVIMGVCPWPRPLLGASTLGNTYSLAVILLLANNIVGF